MGGWVYGNGRRAATGEMSNTTDSLQCRPQVRRGTAGAGGWVRDEGEMVIEGGCEESIRGFRVEGERGRFLQTPRGAVDGFEVGNGGGFWSGLEVFKFPSGGEHASFE